MENVLKVFIAIAAPIGAALRQVLLLFNVVTFAENAEEADLIIAQSARDIANTYRSDKWYAILSLKEETHHAPNVRNIPILEFIAPLLEYIQEIAKSRGTEKTTAAMPEAVIPLLPDAKHILVIEDTSKHQASAKILLAGHQLTVIGSYAEAMELLGKNRYEVVLSDLYLPMSAQTLSDKAFELGKLVPYGLLLALAAARRDAKYVAVATDLNHHADALAAAFDHFFSHTYEINGATVRFLHSPMTEINGESVKDWKRILEILDNNEE
jgi:CheY-like chemotaxis protein